MNHSTNSQEKFPGGPSPDYQPTETQHQATSASGVTTAGSNSQTQTQRNLGGAPGSTADKPSPEGVDVVPEHSVVSRQPEFPSAQSTGNTSSDPPQPAQSSDGVEGKQPPARDPQLETSSGDIAAMAADPKPIILVKSAKEDSGHLSRGPSDAARLRPENLSATPEVPASREAQRSGSVVSHRTNRSLATNGSAFANGAATMAKSPPDVDTSLLQARAASAEGELSSKDKAVINKGECASSFHTLRVAYVFKV